MWGGIFRSKAARTFPVFVLKTLTTKAPVTDGPFGAKDVGGGILSPDASTSGYLQTAHSGRKAN